jgi:hypothetical protein
MRDLIKPIFTTYLDGSITLTELCVALLDFDIEIDRLALNVETGNLEFTFRDITSDSTYVYVVVKGGK